MIEFPKNEDVKEELVTEEMDNIVVLNDENGNPTEFEFLDYIEYEGNEYVVLAPLEGSDVVILRLEAEDPDSDEETYVGVSDVATLEAVFAIFKERFKDVFTFVD